MQNVNSGWTKSKQNDYRGQITDDTYQGIVGYHNPIWKYMINRHDGKTLYPINVLGYTAIPLAIELSQWGFPTTYVTNTFEGVKKAKKDCEIHSGKFDKFYYFDFIQDCPQAKLTIFIDIINDMDDDEVYTFIDMLLRRSMEVICSVRNTRDWRSLLSRKYIVNVSEYNDGSFCLLTIKSNE